MQTRTERAGFESPPPFKFNKTRSQKRHNGPTVSQVVLLVWIGILGAAEQAAAHHPMGGKIPSNFLEGLMSGLGHPVIGFDHLAFVIATGLVAVSLSGGLFVPGAFVLTAMLGTGIHLLAIDLPAPELVIAGSVVLFGAMLLTGRQFDQKLLMGLAAIAGLFHGYAYGEAIIGAETTPLLAYLIGFTLMQLGIAIAAMKLGQFAGRKAASVPFNPIQVAGFCICSVGVVFLTSSFVS